MSRFGLRGDEVLDDAGVTTRLLQPGDDVHDQPRLGRGISGVARRRADRLQVGSSDFLAELVELPRPIDLGSAQRLGNDPLDKVVDGTQCVIQFTLTDGDRQPLGQGV